MTDATQDRAASLTVRAVADALAAAQRETTRSPGITQLGEAHIIVAFLRDHGFKVIREPEIHLPAVRGIGIDEMGFTDE